MRFSSLCSLGLTAFGIAVTAITSENCGPSNNNQICPAGQCCSTHGWCGTSTDYCATANCQVNWSAPDSSCYKAHHTSSTSSHHTTTTTTSKTSTKPSTTLSTATKVWPSQVPNIDVCGAASSGVSCPGAGPNGYFYRCCSSHGHCGPKNILQDEGLYCGVVEAGCQPGFGSCDDTVPVPAAAKTTNSATTRGVAEGDTCGPIVNAICGAGLCCSGSNYCGTGDSFCGSDNWCQQTWGEGTCTTDPS